MPNFESGYRSILGAKLAAADVTMTVATPPTVTSGRIYLNNGAQEERIKFTGVSGSTLTGLVRGLSKTADPATAGTGLSWIAGTPIYLVDMHDQLWDSTKTETITGQKTFTNAIFTGSSVIDTTGSLDVNGKSNPTPVAANEAARDALYTSPVVNDRVYRIDLQAEQIYNGSNRDTIGVGTPTPIASETVAGKVEIATQIDVNTGTRIGGTGAVLSVSPDLLGCFGDGSDGDVTINSGTTTLTQDMYYNNFTLNSTGILDTAGYRIFVKGTFSGNGTIRRNGNNASGATKGTVLNQGSMKAEIEGVNGATAEGGGGTNGLSANPSYHNLNGGTGGAGGNGFALNPGAGSTGGVSTRGTRYNIGPNIMNALSLISTIASGITFTQFTQYKGIGGGGSGGVGARANGGSIAAGGGSGSNGGTIYIQANTRNFTGTIESTGGNGGNGANGSATNGGGGGGGSGGSGGVVIAIGRTFTSLYGTLTLTRGSLGIGGTGSGTGQAGSNGTAGIAGVLIQITA